MDAAVDGITGEKAAEAIGVWQPVGARWFPIVVACHPLCLAHFRKVLSFAERKSLAC